MKLRRKMISIMLFASTLLSIEIWQTAAQDSQSNPPDLRMLMNLDLFESHPNQPNGGLAPPQNDSMLDQIRALNAMGYLGNHGDNPNPPVPNALTIPRSRIGESAPVGEAARPGDESTRPGYQATAPASEATEPAAQVTQPPVNEPTDVEGPQQ